MAEARTLELEPAVAIERMASAGAGPLPADHPTVAPQRIGVVLLNLGTPDATDYWSMRRYLSEFLSDKRVIDYPTWLWQPLLQLVILSKGRPSKGKDYDSIWNKERNESPLKTVTRSQAEKLGQRLEARSPRLMVDWAMRYGNPSVKSVLDRLVEAGCRPACSLMALYPQYAAPTTATAYDKAFDALQGDALAAGPAHHGPPYHDRPDLHRGAGGQYPPASCRRSTGSRTSWSFSYHGMPKRLLLKRRSLSLPLPEDDAAGAREAGLDARADDGLLPVPLRQRGMAAALYSTRPWRRCRGRGIKKIAVISPAFATDCLETLEEIQVENREIFEHAGGEKFTYIPCLNDGEPHIAFLEELALNELQGWL